jgi:hypothetical protein
VVVAWTLVLGLLEQVVQEAVEQVEKLLLEQVVLQTQVEVVAGVDLFLQALTTMAAQAALAL